MNPLGEILHTESLHAVKTIWMEQRLKLDTVFMVANHAFKNNWTSGKGENGLDQVET